MISFQELLRRLSQYWENNGCIIHQGYDLETGAGTMNPATFLRCLGPEPYRAAYIEPCRRPTDGRYGQNPNRLQHYFQFQVILKPSPLNMQSLYLNSLKAIGLNLNQHDIRFVHDDWENPTIGAWGLGWEVWLDGMEVTQYTYFQCVGGVLLKPITGELTYGIERIAMYLQKVNSIFDLQWDNHLTYGDLYHRNEVEFSHYNFEEANSAMWLKHFIDYEQEAKKLIAKKLPLPAYDFVMKASHAFNLLDARGAISVTERTGYITRIRDLAKMIAETYIASREAIQFPLLKKFPQEEIISPKVLPIPNALLKASPEDKQDFLLEIGSEELPATFVPIGMKQLEEVFIKFLNKERLSYSSLQVFGTPRRLALLVKELTLTLKEQIEEKKGPSLTSTFDESGSLTPAGEGFFRSLNKEPIHQSALHNDPDLSIREIKGVFYLFAKKTLPGRSAAAILQENLSQLILNLDFPKKMRWGNLDISYPRPLQWVIALLGEEVIPFALGNLTSGNLSKGHAQLDSNSFVIPSASTYLTTLKEHKVLADPKERKETILEQLTSWEKEKGAKIIEQEKVLPQVLHLVEWPQITEATFDSSFLKAPKEVLISEMVEHQKYFPVTDLKGNLLHYFIITADTTPSKEIQQGNQKVLSARLSDGVFLYEKGSHTSLETLNEKLKNVTFLTGFGSLYDKTLRIEKHIEVLQKTLKISTLERAKRAAQLSKGDLVSEMVFEFPELQGTIGKYYALVHKEEQEIAEAIEEQWMPRKENTPLPKTETGTLLSLADKFDNLICCFAAGLKPTSSSDPYALRRQSLGIIKILIEGQHCLPFRKSFDSCCEVFLEGMIKDKKLVLDEIENYFINRIKTVFQDYGLQRDEIEASLTHGFSDIYDTFCRAKALHAFRQKEDRFPQLYEVYKRAKGQLNNQHLFPFSRNLLREEAEVQLDKALERMEKPFQTALIKQEYDQAYQMIAEIQPALATLFDKVKILADEKELQQNRIALLQRVFGLFGQLLDFNKLQE